MGNSDLDRFAEDLMKVAKELESGKPAKKFLEKEAKKLKEQTLKNAKSHLKAHTGNYFESIKAGDVYDTEDGLSVEAYSASSLAHIIENGHNITTEKEEEGSDVESHGFKKGYYIFDNSAKDFEEEFIENIEEFRNEVFENNGM